MKTLNSKELRKCSKQTGTLSGQFTRDLGTMIEYLWEDEQRHYEEDGKPEGHIFTVLKRLRKTLSMR